MRLSLGINTAFAVKRWPLAADWAPIVRDRLGLTIVQHSFDLVPSGVWSSAAEDLATAATTHGLVVQSTFTGLAAYSDNLLLHPDPVARDEAEAWYRRAIVFSAVLGARATGGHVGAFSVADWADRQRRQERWTSLLLALDRLAVGARTAGLDYLVVENLAAAREPSTMDMVRAMLTEGDDDRVPIRLCLDVGHMCVPGTQGPDRDPYAWLRSLGRDAPMIQLQQSDEDGDHHWPFTTERNAEGRIDADRVIDALGDGGVEESLLLLEILPPFEQDDAAVIDDLAASVDYWREALSRRGVLAG